MDGETCPRRERQITPYQSFVHTMWPDVRIQFSIPVHTHARTRSTTLAHYSFQIFLEPSPFSVLLVMFCPQFILFQSSNKQNNKEMITRSCMGWNCTSTHMMVDCISLNIIWTSHSVSSPIFLSLQFFPPCSLVVVRSSATNHLGPHPATYTKLQPQSQLGVLMFVTQPMAVLGYSDGYASVANRLTTNRVWLVWVVVEKR